MYLYSECDSLTLCICTENVTHLTYVQYMKNFINLTTHVTCHFNSYLSYCFFSGEINDIHINIANCQEDVDFIYQMEQKLYNDSIISLGNSNDPTVQEELQNHSNKSLIQLEATL